jgi:hypothetical protein
MDKHTHCYEGITSIDDCHVHFYEGAASYECDKPCHTHKIKGKTTCCDGHTHEYCFETSQPIPLPDGGHYHTFEGKVKCKCCHTHVACGCTSPEMYKYTKIKTYKIKEKTCKIKNDPCMHIKEDKCCKEKCKCH